LRDIFDENKNLNVIKKKLQSKIQQNILFVQRQGSNIADEDQDGPKKEEDDKKKDVPHYNIEALLKEVGLNENIPKLKENEIDQPEIFFEICEGQLCSLLDIKTEGKKFRFKEKIKEVKDKHEKAKAKKAQMEEVLDIAGNTFETLQKKQTVTF